MANETDAVARLAPAPEVQFLPQLLRRMQQGDLRMPAFQRGYVWKDGQILELLESVYNGFPIGSALLWRVAQPVLRPESPKRSYLPAVPESYPTTFILDGLQRLSTLYAVFNYKSETHPESFDVWFDLRNRRFVGRRDDPEPRNSVPLSALFMPTSFIEHHARLSREDDGPEMVRRAVQLHSIFQEYLIPIVTIADRSVSDVVKIFERINNAGTKLSAVDFMRAVTWSESFDLNAELEALSHAVEPLGLRIKHETMIKVVAIAMGGSPTPEAMIELRGLPARELTKGAHSAGRILKRVARFLDAHLHVHSSNLVPYEAQLLALVGFFRRNGKPTSQQLDRLVKWYWTASLNEDMQGRSEYQVARVVEEIAGLRTGETKRLRGALTLTASTLQHRRFRWGAALSSALVSMFAHAGARSLITGEVIDTADYTSGDAAKNFVGLLPADQVADAHGRPVPAGKLIANVFVASDSDIRHLRAQEPRVVIRSLLKNQPGRAEDVLASQFVPPGAVQALLRGRPQAFLEQRAAAIFDFASKFALTIGRTSSQ